MTKLSKFLLVFSVIVIASLAFNTNNTQVSEHNLSGVHTVQNTGTNKFKSIIRMETIDGRFYCSATVIDGQYALTAAHCVTNAIGNLTEDKIRIYDMVGVDTEVIAKAVAIDKIRDVALIRGEFGNFEFSPVDFNGEDVHMGMSMITCGYPSGDALWCTELVHNGNYYFQYRTKGGPIFKGMSGGSVFSKATGRIIGVNSAVSEDSVIVSPLIGFLANIGF